MILVAIGTVGSVLQAMKARAMRGREQGYTQTRCVSVEAAHPPLRPSLASQIHFHKRGKGLIKCVYKPGMLILQQVIL